MKKSLTVICAAMLVAGLAACNRSGGNSDDDRLNAAAAQLDNSVYDTSPDDATLNQAELPADQAGPGNAAVANAPAPGNAVAPGNSTTTGRR